MGIDGGKNWINCISYCTEEKEIDRTIAIRNLDKPTDCEKKERTLYEQKSCIYFDILDIHIFCMYKLLPSDD